MEWKLPEKKTQAIYQAIMELIVQNIREGELLPGDRLPAERILAQALNVNRSTVTHALDELAALAIIERKTGSGSYISEHATSTKLGDWRYFRNQHNPFAMPSVTELKKTAERPDIIDAYTGELPLELVPKINLPNFSWSDFLNAERLENELGYLPLRAEIAKMHHVSAAEVLITAGSQQGLFLILQVLLNPHKKVAMAMPSFFWSLSLFNATQIERVGIPLVDGKLDLVRLKEKVVQQKIKVLLVNPTYQNPTGVAMTVGERRALVELAKQYQLLIVEDDAFSELHYPGNERLPTLKELAPQQVLYLGSLSKIMGATTKIGWLIAPKTIVEKLAEARTQMDFTMSIFPQVLATSVLTSPEFRTQLTHLQAELKKRSTTVVTLAQESGLTVAHIPAGGYYVWVDDLPVAVNQNFLKRMIEHHIIAAPAYFFGSQAPALRINAARLSTAQAKKFFSQLQAVLDEK